MLEGLVTWVLNTYIGEYVENLNTDQLTIALFQGQVELENLPLKKTALKSLDLPIEVKSGFIGRIQLQIPIRRLHSEHWVITLDRLYLVAGPIKNEEYDHAAEQKREQDRKRNQLQELEDNFKLQKELIQQSDVENKSSSSSTWWSYGSAFITNIVENLQLKVNEIHLRYEDDVTIPGHPFACGVTIKSVSAQSCGSNWEPGFVNRTGKDLMFKLVSLDNFSIYWDSDVSMCGSYTGPMLEEALLQMRKTSSSTEGTKGHRDILEPVSAQAKMQRNTSVQPLRSQDTPRLLVDIELDQFPLSLSETQLHSIVALLRELDRHDRGRKYRRLRPRCPVAENCRIWWKFALDATFHTVREQRMKRSPSFVCKRAKEIVQYTKVFHEYLTIGSKYMSKTSKDFMDRFEMELTFDELKLLRKLVTDDLLEKQAQEMIPVPSSTAAAELSAVVSSEQTATASGQSQVTPGLLQSWFPGWTGWYGYSSSQPTTTAESPSAGSEASLILALEGGVQDENRSISDVSIGSAMSAARKTELDQDILDALSDSAEANTLLKQDLVLLQLNFCLRTGTFQLLTAVLPESSSSELEEKVEKCLIQLECSVVKMGFQSRPRTNGMKFSVSINDFLLQDKMTPNSIRPTLIAPLLRKTGLGHLSASGSTASMRNLDFSQNEETSDGKLFELVYEKKPLRTKADYKLSICTKPLDIIYNPAAIERITEFFTVKKSDTEAIRTELAKTAKNHYEDFKKQTQEELKQSIDSLLEGDSGTRAKRWILDLDISAPHFTIPESFQNLDTMLVVFDLGHLQLRNAETETKGISKLPSDDEDEDFMTPSSTPLNEREDNCGELEKEPDGKSEMSFASEATPESLNESSIRSRIYDRYMLSLSDLQVMVGRAKDSDWKTSYSKRTSLLHVIDKFSISLQFERRLLYMVHPGCPNVAISGKIPQLVLHVNEEKIMALKSCAAVLQRRHVTSRGEESPSPGFSKPTSADWNSRTNFPKNKDSARASALNDQPEHDHPTLLVLDFGIEQMSLEIQSRDCHPRSRKMAECRSLAELQVSRVQAMLTKKAFDTSVKFSVHGLLVVDALQTLGHDYELLVASHKNLCLDSRSGRIFDSHPTSPISPSSPVTPHSPAEPAVLLEGPCLLSNAQTVTSKLQGLVRQPYSDSAMSLNHSRDFNSQSSLPNFQPNAEALITIEVDVMQPRCLPNGSLDEAICLANIEFNSLDIIANQHTIVELVTFFRSMFPAEALSSPSKVTTKKSESERDQTVLSGRENANEMRKELTANFHRLNILLMRVEEKQGSSKKVARKVATVTLADAKIQASIASQLSIEGSLNGLQLLDLTPEGSRRHQKVLHVGIEPSATDSIPSDMLTGKAFVFTISRPSSMAGSANSQSKPQCLGISSEMLVALKVASVYYLHAPKLLVEVSHCITEFKDYLTKIRSSLAVAAKELALGLVNKRTDVHTSTAYEGNWSLDGKQNRCKTVGGSAEDLIFDGLSTSAEREDIFDKEMEEKASREQMDFVLDAVLASPIILLPKLPSNHEVLAVSLGKIIISNSSSKLETDFNAKTSGQDTVLVEARDMSMYSLMLDETDISRCMESKSLVPILHHTTLELTVTKLKENLLNTDLELSEFLSASPRLNLDAPKQLFQVTGQISPLKLVLTKPVFEQILKTLDNITPDEDFVDSTSPVDHSSGLKTSDTQKFQEPDTTISSELLTSPSSSVGGNSRTSSDDKLLVVKGNFKLPMLHIVMMSALGEKECDVVDVKLENFCLDILNVRWFKAFDICLESLVVEDLLHGNESTGPQYIMRSHGTSRRHASARNLSKMVSISCPTSFLDLPPPPMPPSLPSNLCLPQQTFFVRKTKRNASLSDQKEERNYTDDYSFNLPSSPNAPLVDEEDVRRKQDPLVHIKVHLIDKKCPDFETKYNRVNRTVAVDFNCLETQINLDTWVLALEFLGIGGKVWDPEMFTQKAQMTRETPVSLATLADQEIINMEIDLKVQSLSLVLNKKEYQLAKASVTAFEAHVSTRDTNFDVKGQLGSVSLQDSSPNGNLYRERFITTGDKAVDFHVFKYGMPDPDVLREFDVSVTLSMTSVWYIHTHRFLQEILAFAQNFNQLQDVLGRSRASTIGKKITEKASHNARIKMDIDAGAPVLLIPHSSRTKDVLVLDLGKLRVLNRFLFDSDSQLQEASEMKEFESKKKRTKVRSPVQSPSIFNRDSVMSQGFYGSPEKPWRKHGDSASMLSDPSSSSFIIPGLFSLLSSSHVRYTTNLGRCVAEVPASSLSSSLSVTTALDETVSSDKASSQASSDVEDYRCLLDVMQIELFDMEVYSAEWLEKSSCANPKADDLVFPSFVITRQRRKILKERCRLCLEVRRNLDVDLSHAVPDISINGKLSSVQLILDTKQYQLIRGLLAHNFGEQLEEFQSQLMSHLKDPKAIPVLSGNLSIGLSINLDLENVELSLLLAHEDSGCQEVSLAKFDFVRSNLKIETRSDGSKEVGLVSHEIKVHDTRYKDLPVNVRPNMFSEILRSAPSCSHQRSLQLELHCRLNRDCNCYTILLNNMRVFGIFDWLLAVKDFLAQNPDDPFKHDKELKEQGASNQANMFIANSGSIVTKRIPAIEQKEPLLELCINMTNTELVIVENSSDRDTNAIIMKGTALISYRQRCDRLLMCNLQSLEVFSCSLAAEEETALSIIDPMSLNIELNKVQDQQNSSAGLLDAACYEDRPPILEVSFQRLSIRLSYNDIKLFSAILNSMPKQLLRAKNPEPPPRNASQAILVAKLADLGFTIVDCEAALKRSNDQLENAALWLTENAKPIHRGGSKTLINISGFEIKEGTISLCLIDDCQDADVPLAEIVFSDIYTLHRFLPHSQGKAKFTLIGDYYNRSLSGWEPFLEKLGCTVEWHQGIIEEGDKLYVEVQACEMLNLNLTRTLIEQYSRTKAKWIDDYSTSMSKENSLHYNSRKRIPFVPYAIRNQTGCNLKFMTINSAPRSHISGIVSDGGGRLEHQWRTVVDGSELTFLIDERDKIRHKVTHELKVHQLKLKVDGWKEIGPVSVDKVGVFFRKASPDIDSTSKIFQEMPCARIVFEVKIEGTARKVVTIRSALVFNNQLEDPIEVKMEKGGSRSCTMSIAPFSSMPLPLEFVYSKLWVRPSGWSLDWCCTPIEWQAVTKPGDIQDSFKKCNQIGSNSSPYRLCIAVYKQRYPEDGVTKRSVASLEDHGMTFADPGHIITVMPPLQVENLLPIDMTFNIKASQSQPYTSTVKAGKKSYLVGINLSHSMELCVTLENFPTCKELVIPAGTTDHKVRMSVFDGEKRPLELQVYIKARLGGSLKLSISAPYWLINRTGLPLLFKQDGGSLAAGQMPEHEIARSVVPLLFSFPDKNSSEYCTMRIGNSVHGPGTAPQWCQHFILERGIAFRQLYVAQRTRPDWVYNIGIESRQGRGPYCDTNIVTFTPRYQLDNRSCHKLAFTQRHLANSLSPTDANYLSALPKCLLPFHWPRVDLDTLLCVRIMDIALCSWSGGFQIDAVDSFHINMRAENNRCVFLRVDIVLQGAMYIVVFTDAENMPPPYRIDNFAEVNVEFCQSQVEYLKTYIKPHTSMAYAWDQLTLPPVITLKVPSGTSATYDMKNVGDGEKLCYENFIYIAFTHTFKRSSSRQPGETMSAYRDFEESQKLVLDVIPPDRVILKPKETGKRSQLWRMTSTGLLQHEGTSVPRDPKNPSMSSVMFVLDIKDIALQPNREMPLTIRKPDERRKSTQTWKFIDGRLRCGDKRNLVVQAKDGIFGLRDGGEAMLGPSVPSSRTVSQEVPKEMAIHREKHQPGSGFLCVKILNDGPTRVLQITDINQQEYEDGRTVNEWVLIREKKQRPVLESDSETKAKALKESSKSFSPIQTFKVSVRLQCGLGISVVDKTPQEIVYLSLHDLHIEYSWSKAEQILQVDIKSLQMDNQMFGARRQVLLYVSSPGKVESETNSKPALQICAHKISNSNWNAEIYKQLLVSCKPITLHVEEKVLWKLMKFIGFNQQESELEMFTECHAGMGRVSPVATLTDFKRYYFGALRISKFEVALSMHTSRDMSPDLKAIKRSLHIPLIRFEDAQVELDPFVKFHLFETSAFLLESIKLHYTQELRSQAAKILGSVDFLGNPIGLFSDMAEGVSCLLEGNVPGMLKNVTRGMSNTAAKVSSTLSDTVEIVTFDKKHQLERQQIFDQHNEGGKEHLKAGLKNLWHGMFGAVTSIPLQTYTEMQEKGPLGLLSGLTKGVVGTLAKPMAGVLDFTSGAASAIRDSSKGRYQKRPPKVRKPRCCYGHGGLLPSFSAYHADAQELLFQQNQNNFDEMFIAKYQLQIGAENESIYVLISSQQLYFMQKQNEVILQVSYKELFQCQWLRHDGKCYIELTMKDDVDGKGMSAEIAKRRPRIRCDSESIAQQVVQHIIYAKNLYDEIKQTLPPDDVIASEFSDFTP